jgi:L-fuconolactonase
VHVACDDSQRFALRPTGVGSQWWSQPDGVGPAVGRATQCAGATHVVVVQAVGASGHDCACASDVVESPAGYASLVTSVDMTAVDVSRSLRACAGWRLFGVGDGAPWLDDERADLVWSRAADLDAVIIPTNFTDRLDSLAAVATRYPTVRVALDHCAFTDMGGASKNWLARHATRHLDQQQRSWIFLGTAVELGWVSAR